MEEVMDIFSVFSSGKKRILSEFSLLRGAYPFRDCYL